MDQTRTRFGEAITRGSSLLDEFTDHHPEHDAGQRHETPDPSAGRIYQPKEG